MSKKKDSNLAELLIKPRKQVKHPRARKQAKEQQAQDQHGENNSSQLSPRSLLFAALKAVYGIPDDREKFNDFMLRLVTSLSLLSTAGADSMLFGRDFNTFYQTFVQTLNVCGYLKQQLDDNNISVDIEKFLKSINQESDDEQSSSE